VIAEALHQSGEGVVLRQLEASLFLKKRVNDAEERFLLLSLGYLLIEEKSFLPLKQTKLHR
jgi:hypothetical protein